MINLEKKLSTRDKFYMSVKKRQTEVYYKEGYTLHS